MKNIISFIFFIWFSNYMVWQNICYLFLQNNPEALYTIMSAVQADVLVSNKVNIPGSKYFINY